MMEGAPIMRGPVVLPHALRGVIVAAARGRSKADVLALAAASRAVLEHSPDLGVAGAYELVDRLWVR
ncbi:MAG: hypothetical protein NVV74_04490 [Magnetospirillum sp.]|nr:hypothetical protein [Magnetospirillum sp.]